MIKEEYFDVSDDVSEVITMFSLLPFRVLIGPRLWSVGIKWSDANNELDLDPQEHKPGRLLDLLLSTCSAIKEDIQQFSKNHRIYFSVRFIPNDSKTIEYVEKTVSATLKMMDDNYVIIIELI